MIESAARPDRAVFHPLSRIAPRWLRPWRPGPGAATSIEAASTRLGQARVVEAPALQPAAPGFVPVAGLPMPPAHSVEILALPDVDAVRRCGAPACLSVGPSLGLGAPDEAAAPADDLAMRLSAVLRPPLQLLMDPEGPMEWVAPLLPYQCDGVAALLRQRELLLADDMGLGKTIQAIAAVRILFRRGELSKALVVSPASLLAQWNREFRKWAPELTAVVVSGAASDRGIAWRRPAQVRIVSYDTLRGDVLELRDSPALRERWSVVILDEASRIKNSESGVSIACKRLPRDRRWALTGTPLENRLDDVVSILSFLLGDADRRGGVTPDSVRETLRRVQLRRKKEDVLQDLPPKQVHDISVDLLPAQRAAYDLAEKEGVVRLQEAGPLVTVTHVLELISRLKQICNCDAASGESAKMEDIEERMATLTAEGHRALVFSQFTDDRYGVGLVARRLQQYDPLTYTGAMSAAQKAETIDRFASDTRHGVLALSLRAGGVGLNLQSASYVFHLDRWWNPAIEDQADGRAHRMGQEFPVTVYRYLCTETIEERIDAILREKRQLFRDVVDEVSLDLEHALSAEELFGLFSLKPPPRERAPVEPARDFGEMTGVEFEEWLADRLVRAGFNVERTPATRDGGIDLTASRSDILGIASTLVIQCKNHREPVGVAVVREVRGATHDRAPGTTPVVACPGGFTAEAVRFARSSGVQLWGPEELIRLRAEAVG